jgi:hypothetical protein
LDLRFWISSTGPPYSLARELGYVEGKNVDREAAEENELYSVLLGELARLNVDVIITAGPSATRAGKKATATIKTALPLTC